jgi:hypothetical protein
MYCWSIVLCCLDSTLEGSGWEGGMFMGMEPGMEAGGPGARPRPGPSGGPPRPAKSGGIEVSGLRVTGGLVSSDLSYAQPHHSRSRSCRQA